MAVMWDMSPRRVAQYCEENRIKGAFIKGKTWLIPANAKKPVDKRYKQTSDSK